MRKLPLWWPHQTWELHRINSSVVQRWKLQPCFSALQSRYLKYKHRSDWIESHSFSIAWNPITFHDLFFAKNACLIACYPQILLPPGCYLLEDVYTVSGRVESAFLRKPFWIIGQGDNIWFSLLRKHLVWLWDKLGDFCRGYPSPQCLMEENSRD